MERRNKRQTAVTQVCHSLAVEMGNGRATQHLERHHSVPHTTPSARASDALKVTRPQPTLCDCGLSRITAEMGFPASRAQQWGLERLMAVLRASALVG